MAHRYGRGPEDQLAINNGLADQVIDIDFAEAKVIDDLIHMEEDARDLKSRIEAAVLDIMTRGITAAQWQAENNDFRVYCELLQQEADVTFDCVDCFTVDAEDGAFDRVFANSDNSPYGRRGQDPILNTTPLDEPEHWNRLENF